jgi:hypothetical protein
MVFESLVKYFLYGIRADSKRVNVLWLSDLVFVGLGELLVLWSIKYTALHRMGSNSVRICPLFWSNWMTVFSSPILKDFPCDKAL